MEQQCIFCQLISGAVPSKKVYEDDYFVGILDIYPANPAHILLMPKKHTTVFNQLPSDATAQLGISAKNLVRTLFGAFKPDGVNLYIANGAAAGQKAPHLIIHIIPRFQGDGLKFETPWIFKKNQDEAYARIKKAVLNYFPEQEFDYKGIGKPEDNVETNKKSIAPTAAKPKKEVSSNNVDIDSIARLFT